MWKHVMVGLSMASCAPKYASLPPMDPVELWTPGERKSVMVGDVEVSYVDEGPRDAATTVVFVHGLSSWMGFWEHQVPAFAAQHRVLALDLPGYGASGRPDAPFTPPWYADLVDAWLQEVGVEEAVLVGHSMGGQIALHYALEPRETSLKALVLSAPAGFERFKPGAARWLKNYWHEERALASQEDEMRATFRTLVFNRQDDGVERLLQERVRMQQHESFRGTSVAVSRSIAGMLDYPVADRLGEIATPTLVVFGTDDRMIPNSIFNGGQTAAVAKKGAEAMGDAKLVMLKGAGHTVHHDDPEGFNAAVASFLGSP